MYTEEYHNSYNGTGFCHRSTDHQPPPTNHQLPIINSYPTSNTHQPPATTYKPISNIQHLTSNSGYALYLVLVVLFVAGILFSVSIRSSGAAHIQSVRHVQYLQAGLLAQSGIARAEYFLNGGDGKDLNWETEEFKEKIGNYGTIIMSCRPFGLFSRVASTGSRFDKSYSLKCIMGRDVPRDLEPVITLTGHVGGLVLSQGTTIDGKVVLHHGTVKRGNNKSPIPNAQTWVTQRESPPIPFDIEKISEFMENATERVSDNHNNEPESSAVQNDFSVMHGDYDVGQNTITDRKLIVTGALTMGRGAVCRGSMFLCKQVTITDGKTDKCVFFSDSLLQIKGGAHAAQFFSNDSIIIGKDARFDAGALWVSHRVQNSDTTLSGGIVFPEKVTLNGHVICFTDSIEDNSEVRVGPAVVLGEQSAFNGTIITDGDISMKNIAINGHIWARSIVTIDDKISYKNWLLGCTVKKLKDNIPFPLLGDTPVKVSLIDH